MTGDFPATPPPSPPIVVDGHTFYLSFHAVHRAHQMGVPIKLVPHIIRQGVRRESRKYADRNAYHLTAGKVTAAIIPEGDDWSVISTFLWASDEAWDEWFQKANGRTGGRTQRHHN